MNRDEQQTLLLKGSIEVEGRVVASSNQALLVTVSLDGLEGTGLLQGRGRRASVVDFPDGLWRREVAAYELDVALETGLVPTHVGRGRPFGVGSLQWWVTTTKRTTTSRCASIPSSTTGSPRSRLRLVANNGRPQGRSRHLTTGNAVGPSTTGCASTTGQTAHRHLGVRRARRQRSFARADRSLRERRHRSRGRLAQSNRAGARAGVARADWCENATYPIPDEDSDWPPYPWPLI